MPEQFIQLPADSTGKRLRTRERTVNSQVVQEQYVIPASERVITNKIMVTTFRTPGNAAVAQNLFSLFNATGSGVILAVRRLAAYMDTAAALTAVVPSIRASRITAAATGGVELAKGYFDTAPPASPAGVVARGAQTADTTTGTNGASLTATLVGNPLWEAFGQRLHTAVGQVLTDPMPVLPAMIDSDPFLIRPGEGIVAHVFAHVATSNPNTNQYVVNCMFEEFTLP